MNLLRACLLLIIINLSLSFPTNGNAALLDDVCTKTPYPNECHDCLAANSGATQMTVRELAGAVMYCTYNLSNVLQKAFVDLANGVVPADPNVRGTYKLCESGFDDFTRKLVAAMTWWWNWDDKIAKEEFDDAKVNYEKCKDGLLKLSNKKPLPPEVDGQFKGVNNLYGVSHAIILQCETNSHHV